MTETTVGHNLLKPAVGLINRLHYPQKFVLISVCFLLPLGLAIFLLLSEIQGQIQFAQLEKQGLAYLEPLQQLQQTILIEPLTSPGDMDGRTALSSQEGVLRENLSQAQSQWGEKLNTEIPYLSLQASLANTADPGETKKTLEAIALLRTQVGNQSNLILDPDLDSYYLMEALLLKLPGLQENLAELQGIMAENSGQNLSLLAESQLLVIKAQLKELNNDLNHNLGVAFVHNANRQLEPKVTHGLHSLATALENLDHTLAQVLNGKQTLDDPALIRQGEWSLLNSLHFWKVLRPELGELLTQRIQRFQQRQWLLSTFVLATLAIAVYLFWGFYTSVMETVRSLSSAAEKMVAGSQTKAVELQTQDEMAEVVHAFNTVADALCRLTEKLQDENLRLEAEIDITRQLQQMLMPSEQELAAVAGTRHCGVYGVGHRGGGRLLRCTAN